MPESLIRRHDQFFKHLLDRPGAAGTLLRERLPRAVTRLLADEPPELMAGSFVTQTLSELRSDRLYRTRTVTGRPVLIYALIEHKSSPDPLIGVQLLGYKAQILKRWIDNTDDARPPGCGPLPLPAVLSLVVYHGAERWAVPETLAEAVDADADLRPYLVDFRYTLADLGRIADPELSADQALRVRLLVLKWAARDGDLRALLRAVLEAAAALGLDDLVAALHYILGELDESKAGLLREVLAETIPGQEEPIMLTLGEKFKAEGRAEGKAEAMAATLLKLLSRRFGPVPSGIEQRVRSAGTDQLDAWLDAVIDAPTLDDVFR
jgi:predicted transposase YdaD